MKGLYWEGRLKRMASQKEPLEEEKEEELILNLTIFYICIYLSYLHHFTAGVWCMDMYILFDLHWIGREQAFKLIYIASANSKQRKTINCRNILNKHCPQLHPVTGCNSSSITVPRMKDMHFLIAIQVHFSFLKALKTCEVDINNVD